MDRDAEGLGEHAVGYLARVHHAAERPAEAADRALTRFAGLVGEAVTRGADADEVAAPGNGQMAGRDLIGVELELLP